MAQKYYLSEIRQRCHYHLYYLTFVENFCVYVHQEYWSVRFFSCGILVWICYQANAGLIR